MRRAGAFPLIAGAALGLLAGASRAEAWQAWAHHPHHWMGPRAAPAALTFFPAAPPVPGYRLFYPPGLPLSYQDPSSEATYCFSPATGFYFVCGYSRPAREYADHAAPLPPGGLPPAGEETPPQASGMLLFRLPAGAEASVDGEPVGLSAGLGAAAVAPGRHRVLLRMAGRETAETVAVASRAILTVTPGGIAPAGP